MNVGLKYGAILYHDKSDKLPPYYSKPGPGTYQANQTGYNDKVIESLSKHIRSQGQIIGL